MKQIGPWLGGSLMLLASCSPSPDADVGARVLCGFAEVLLLEADLAKFEKLFPSEASVGAKVCRAIIPGWGVSDAPQAVLTDGPYEISLPTGETVTVLILDQ